MGSSFFMDPPDWRVCIQVRQNRHSQRQKGLLTLIATCLVPETYFRLRRSANTHRAMHPKTSYGHFETISAFPAT